MLEDFLIRHKEKELIVKVFGSGLLIHITSGLTDPVDQGCQPAAELFHNRGQSLMDNKFVSCSGYFNDTVTGIAVSSK